MDEIPASEFDGRDFDAKEVVQRYRKRVPLPQLQAGLRSQHAATRQELVELINEKYADFVSLSSRMQGVERALKPLRAPLEESSELMKSLHGKLGALLDQAGEAHKAMADIRERKDALTTYIENAKLLQRAKEAAGSAGAGPSSASAPAQIRDSGDVMREHVVQENVARDLRRIRLNLGGRLRTPAPEAASAAGGVTPAAGGVGRAGARAALAAVPASSPPEPLEDDVVEPSGPECKALLEEASAFEESFAQCLQERLRALATAAKRTWEAPQGDAAAVRGPPPSRTELLAMAHISRALVTIGRSDYVEDAFAAVFVQGTLDASEAACSKAAEEAQRRALSADPSGSGGSGVALCIGAGAVDLEPFFSTASASLLAEGAPILWLAQRLSGSGGDGGDIENALLAVPSLRLVANALTAQVLKHVQRVWPNTFMPAFPDVFAANYIHAAKFLRAAEARMAPAERDFFAKSPAFLDFQRRWKTQVYSSLRAKEAVQRLEAAGEKTRTAASAAPAGSPPYQAGGQGFWLQVSAELVTIIEVVWGDRWYLDALYAKMVQLSLELLARYGKIVRGLVDSTEAGAKASEAAPPAPPPPGGVPGAPGGAAPAPCGWDASANPPCWTVSSFPVRLARVAADLMAVLQGLAWDAEGAATQGSIVALMLGRLQPAASTRPRQVVYELLQETRAALEPVMGSLEAAVLREVAAAVSPQFAAIRVIPSFYRMLNKPVPTKASAYVESSLQPIKALLEDVAKAVPKAVVQGWVAGAVQAAALEFSAQAAQLLESTHQQEASLRRLSGRGAAGGDAQVSDLDKIHIQLCLDAEVFTTAVAALGVSSSTSAGLAKLAEVVAPVRHVYEAHRPPAA